MKPSDILNDAADLLEEKGWCTGDLVNAQGHHCVRGAIIHFAPMFRDWNKADRYLADALGVDDTVAWNDRQRDRRVVVRALRRAARSAS